MTANPSVVPAITSKQTGKLKKLIITDYEWSMLLALTDVLNPFDMATKILSGKEYQTLSKSWVLLDGLRDFLNSSSNNQETDDFEHEYQHLKTDNYYATRRCLKVLLSDSLIVLNYIRYSIKL